MFMMKIYKDDECIVNDECGKLDISQKKRDELLCDIAYYKNEIEKQIVHGYHDESKCLHENGKYHLEFLKTK